ncbi:MAG: hypothetical protein R3E58_21035 [Phycisphaerae bacterium]
MTASWAKRKFIDDITIPGMLHGACRFADHPRALVESIDTSAAAKVPGVHRVITAADAPRRSLRRFDRAGLARPRRHR